MALIIPTRHAVKAIEDKRTENRTVWTVCTDWSLSKWEESKALIEAAIRGYEEVEEELIDKRKQVSDIKSW